MREKRMRQKMHKHKQTQKKRNQPNVEDKEEAFTRTTPRGANKKKCNGVFVLEKCLMVNAA